jgi:thymidine kinase
MLNPGFTLYYGCMFAGKTTAMLNHVQKADLQPHQMLVLKPNLDTRNRHDLIVTHDKVKVAGFSVKLASEIENLITQETQLIAIDELQFFDKAIVDFISEWKKKLQIVASGLNKDYKKKDFGSMPQLIALADMPIQLYAKCNHCQKPAEFTYRIVQNNSLILPGNENFYEARCVECY